MEFLPPFFSGKMSSCLSHVLASGMGRIGGVLEERGLLIRLGMVLCSVSNSPLCSISGAKTETLESTCAGSREQSMGKVAAERGQSNELCTAESGNKCSITPEPSH